MPQGMGHDPVQPVTLQQLRYCLNNPAKTWFRQKLGVVFEEASGAIPDDEPFDLDGLSTYGLLQEIALSLSAHLPDGQDAQRIAQRLTHVARSGRLPLGSQAQRLRQQTQHELEQMLHAWRIALADYPQPAPRQHLHHTAPLGVVLEDWLDPLHQSGTENAAPVWLMLTASKWGAKASKDHKKEGDATTAGEDSKTQKTKKTTVRIDKMLAPWLMQLAALAHGIPLSMRLIGPDGVVHISPMPMDQTQAQVQLDALLDAYQQGQAQALPLPFKTALAWVKHAQESPDKAREEALKAYAGDYLRDGEVAIPYWQRLWPDAEDLIDHTAFGDTATRLYGPLHTWATSAAVRFEGYVTPDPTPPC